MKEGFVEFQGHLFDVTKWLEVRCNGPASCFGGGGGIIFLPFEINSTKKHVVKLNIRNIDILYP